MVPRVRAGQLTLRRHTLTFRRAGLLEEYERPSPGTGARPLGAVSLALFLAACVYAWHRTRVIHSCASCGELAPNALLKTLGADPVPRSAGRHSSSPLFSTAWADDSDAPNVRGMRRRIAGLQTARYSASSMPFFRVLSLVAVFGWQIFAGGQAVLLRYCLQSGRAVAMSDCACPEQARTQSLPGAQVSMASCCAFERSEKAPAPLATYSPSVMFVGVAPAISSVRNFVASVQAIEVALREVPQAQGPPVFLKVRSLLI